jgi:hypothetical protein
VQEDQKWAREMEQYLVDKKNAPAASHQGVEPSAAYKAFAKAGCSKEFLREYVYSCSSRKEKNCNNFDRYARVQERFKKKVETLADGRQIVLDFDHLPQLNENARIFTENGSTFSVSQVSRHGAYPVTLSTAGRDALRFNESGPLAMIEKESLHFIANRMCPKCYCGPVAESECGNVKTHQGQHIPKGQLDGRLGHRAIQAHMIDNSCRRCHFLGQDVREYPLYDPVVAEGAGNSERVERDTAVVSVFEGFDECIRKLPAIGRIFSELRLKRVNSDPLCISSLPPESLELMLRCARAAVIRHHLSTTTPNQNGDSSFGLILWRAIKCSNGWRDIRQKWIRYCFGSDRVPSMTLLESTTFFAAVVAPLVMQEFSSQERVLFANGSFASIPGVWDRLIEASQIPLQFASNAAQSSTPFSDCAPSWFDFVFVGLLEIAFGFVIFTAYAIVAYWPSRLLTMLLDLFMAYWPYSPSKQIERDGFELPMLPDPFMIRIFYSVMLSWILIGAFISNLSIIRDEQFRGVSKRYAQIRPKVLMLMLLKFLGCGLSLACAIYLVHDFVFPVPMLLLAHSPLWFCAQYCVPLVAQDSALSRTKLFFANLLKVWFQQRSIRQTFAECLQTLFKSPVYLLEVIKTCTSYILWSNAVFHFGLLCLCMFVDRISLEPGVLEPTPNWMQIVKVSQCVWYLELVLVVAVPIAQICAKDPENEENQKTIAISPFLVVLVFFLAHLPLIPIYAALSNGTIGGEAYYGIFHDNGTEHNQTIPKFFGFNRFNDTRSGVGNQTWYNGDKYQGEWRDNNMNGKGAYRWSDGQVYQGDWIDGKRSGYGIQTWPGGEVYQGQWNNHKRNGKGNLTIPNVAVYEGEFVDDNYHGLGTISFTDGRVFKGEFRNGVYDEQGNVTLPSSTPHIPSRSIAKPVFCFSVVVLVYAVIFFIVFVMPEILVLLIVSLCVWGWLG